MRSDEETKQGLHTIHIRSPTLMHLLLPSDESFRLPVLDPDVKTGLFYLFTGHVR